MLKHGYNQSSVIIFRSDFIYDIVEHMKPSAPAAGTKKSSRKRPTVSSQFKVSLHFFIFFCYLRVLHDLLDIVDFVPFHHCPSLLRVGLLIPVTWILEKELFYCQQNSGAFWCYTALSQIKEW